jgi:hypothetical protein
MGSIIRKIGITFTLAVSFLVAGCADAGGRAPGYAVVQRRHLA